MDLLNVPSFPVSNGPVKFDTLVRPPTPPPAKLGHVPVLGDWFSDGLKREQFGSSRYQINGVKLLGAAAFVSSVGAAVVGSNKLKAGIRAIGVLGLTVIYLGAAK